MNQNNNNQGHASTPAPSQDGVNSNTSAHSSNGRPIFMLTMDPNALEREIDQATQALHSTVNSFLNTMQSSVFGGLETLSREMSALERSSRRFMEDHPFESYQNQFPWNLRSDGPKKRYRITIEELPPLTEEEIKEQAAKKKKSGVMTTSKPDSNNFEGQDGEDFTITQGKVGTADEGKTVITASVAPGLLDWLLFTTHEDSFFRRLGTGSGSQQTGQEGATIHELKDEQILAPVGGEAETQKTSRVPALVEKVKQVGTNWEKDARHWWQRKRGDQSSDDASPAVVTQDQQHHLFSGTSQSKKDQEEERLSQRWPRGSWGRSESYSQSTITRPDGTIEHRTVNTINGETETIVKIQHPDGSIEETVTREGNSNSRHGGNGFFKLKNRDGNRRREGSDQDSEQDLLESLVVASVSE
ncbi:hypothetical protein FBU30_004206 [Linnemannia zychae]|nr:hypothetical protein FBU30_004206 [Linnemannia zychae]